ncbi:MAG: rhomboid family intramembrane serine protease [Opitutaceae bacterium]|nr:rhomboid family intramembrane serine protease [Verrucomicrobiales bacterium]
MLADRHYMRESSGRVPQPVSVILMIILVVIFALQCINDVYLETPIESWLALTFIGLKSGYIWQLVTFQFLHGGVLHLLGNLLGLWFFGRFVENVVGRKRFLFAYLACGVLGGLLQGIFMVLFPSHFGVLLYGASAGVSGMFAIFAKLEADTEVRWNLILPIKAKTLLLIYAGVALFFTLVPSQRDLTAHAAHLGGILGGLAFVRLGWHHDFTKLPWEEWWDKFKQPRIQPRRQPVRTVVISKPQWRREQKVTVPEPTSGDFISSEVDPILDKISAKGIHSLTDLERQVLEAARKKMARR